MILSLNHHHQKGQTACPAPAHHTSDNLSSHDELLTHYQHLETLLDSALATLTLIHGISSSPVYTPHLLGVLRVLDRHITQPSPITMPSDSTTATTATTTPTNAPKFEPPTATYAAVTVADPQPALTCEAIKHESPARAAHLCSPPKQPTRVVIRFDKMPTDQPKPVRASPLHLYKAISLALADCDIGNAALVAGVQWSRKGNLVLRPATDTCTAKLLSQQFHRIWPAIRPLLKLSEDYKCPVFETDEQWHSVVFHGVPMPPTRRAGAFSSDLVDISLQTSGASHGVLKSYSVLCHPEDFQTRDSLALRVSLSSEVDAAHLIKNGGFMAGTWCRVSPYAEKLSISPPLHTP
ncbi:hypothetical protein MVEN_00450700 [Mycena venus]|uniref:Uncharacterized protein n=1 Tax=Mycena venus TaxID=2733690 RepID=A0A8H6YT02_9AGAR|nr:hypothetical protein MVEN_00450700 [Mycena venus]